jgi:hypothetical protein
MVPSSHWRRTTVPLGTVVVAVVVTVIGTVVVTVVGTVMVTVVGTVVVTVVVTTEGGASGATSSSSSGFRWLYTVALPPASAAMPAQIAAARATAAKAELTRRLPITPSVQQPTSTGEIRRLFLRSVADYGLEFQSGSESFHAIEVSAAARSGEAGRQQGR